MDEYRKIRGIPSDSIPDNRLLKKLRKDPELFALVYEKHKDYIYKYLLGRCRDVDLAEDLVAETFESAFRSLHLYKNRSSLRTWLVSIARNKYIDLVRKRKADSLLPEHTETLGSAHRFPDEDLIALTDLLDRLPEEYNEVVKLRILADLPHDEIANLLGKKVATIRTLYSRGIESLMRYLNTEGRGTYDTGG